MEQQIQVLQNARIVTPAKELATMQATPSSRFARVITTMAVGTMLSLSLAASHAKTAPAAADVQVSQAWIRATVKGQMGTGGFMTLTSAKGATLLGFSSPVAKANQLHEMAMEGDVMRMREIANLPLPAGQAVALKPGGHHLMLVKLKKTLKAGEHVPLTLKLKDSQGRSFTQKVLVPVQATATDASSTGASTQEAGHMHH